MGLTAQSNLEKALQEDGHPSFTNGVFLPIGGGTHDVNILMLLYNTNAGIT